MLGENFESEYSCCQMEAVGFAPCCANQCACFKDCPTLGLCLEACCCSALSVSFSRIYAMHRYNVRPDPWDWKCIEFSNCMQCLSCICHVAASIDKNFEDAAQVSEVASAASSFGSLTEAAALDHRLHRRLRLPRDGWLYGRPDQQRAQLPILARDGAGGDGGANQRRRARHGALSTQSSSW